MDSSEFKPSARQGTTSPIMEQSMQIAQSVHKMHNSLVWGITNAVLLAIIVYDMIYSSHLCTTTVEIIKRIAAVFFVLNTVFHLCRYMWISTTLPTVELTPTQKTLLGIKDSDPYFRTCSTPVRSGDIRTVPSFSDTPLNLSCTSWMSTSLLSSESNKTTLPSQSWLYSQTSTSAQYTSPSSREVIQDEQSLSHYLKGYENFEKNSVISTSTEQPSNLLSTYWSHPASRSSADVSPVLKRCVYQIAPPSPAQALSGVGSIDETGSPSLYHHADVWRRNNINPNVLTIWIANLRMWISQTILERVVSEINAVDSALHSHGLVDISIGVVGLERLKKTAQIPQVAYNVPSLPCLVPFLEISTNQEYVVQRIRELAKGGSMSEYKWNSGGTWNGKEWGDHLPTDAALVMHLVATYLDSQLPPLPSLPDGRPFSSQHFVKLPNEPTKNVLTIVQVSANPPHYQLQTKEETFNIPKGRNNLFCTILLFLHIIKTKEHGMLGRMNLGRSGVNMLCVIES